jgi:hypothetical protein
MRIIGFDTDAKGSIALLDFTHLKSKSVLLDIYPVPNRLKLLKNGTKRLEVDYPALITIMADLISSAPVTRAYLEDQWSRPMQDAGATFTFGKTFGDCRSATAAALLATGLTPEEAEKRIVFVPGGDWKSEMRLSSDKKLSLELADKLFPECSHAWKLTSKHTSAAEAALLSLYGATKEGVRLLPGTVVSPPKKPICSSALSLTYLR